MSTGLESLAGSLQLRPGEAIPDNLISTRRNWSAQLTRGRAAAELPAFVACLYNLCGQSHALCSQLALNAASDTEAIAHTGAVRLQCETAREHIRRIALDWPRLISGSDRQAGVGGQRPQTRLQPDLAQCPALGRSDLHADALGTTREWLENGWIGLPLKRWLEQWQRQGDHWLLIWSRQSHTWLASLFREAFAITGSSGAISINQTPAQPPRLEWIAGNRHAMFAALADKLHNDNAFSLRPQLGMQCAQTGTWTRHYESFNTPDSLTGRLGSRIADLLRLCLPDSPGASGAGWLASGGLNLGPGRGVAWLEMARGLLIHTVQLDSSHLATATVESYQVLAPTEWNFHPMGAVARYLESYQPEDPALGQKVGLLIAAFDPCVPFSLPEFESDEVPLRGKLMTRAGINHA